MKSINIPEVRLGIVAVSRDCFPIALSTRRRQNIVTSCKTKGFEPYECSVTVENETDMLKAVEEVKAAGCNALTVFLTTSVPRRRRPSSPNTSTAPSCTWRLPRVTAT